MIGRFKDLMKLSDGEWLLSFIVRDDPRKLLDKIKDKILNIEIKKHDPKRSLDANALCWSLCSDIGKALYPPISKEEVYRKAIRDVGVYEPLPIRNDVVESFQRRWVTKGIGWFADVIDDSKLPGYKLVFAYYGSSTYDVSEMSKLLDYLVDEAEQLGIKIPLSKEREDALNATYH